MWSCMILHNYVEIWVICYTHIPTHRILCIWFYVPIQYHCFFVVSIQSIYVFDSVVGQCGGFDGGGERVVGGKILEKYVYNQTSLCEFEIGI